ncbi:hypothetical protein LWC33_17140 [Pseudonocardia sp. RS11V-5]|uniref:hypothetical protein n=1 Tax=Pseudonocardia terrae TaxID=2905831 RepID=UPI001E55D018|nr:hypothetical protein [Pseudonocardia terrae]MCE3553175.1 hypothetical protein [Pseudonocardia terrae]
MTGTTWRVPRSRGALAGLLLVLLGAWGALIPVVGPIFGYGYTPDLAWTMTPGRWFLQVLPGAAVFVGGLILLGAGDRVSGTVGGWLAAAGGAWFVVGPILSGLWDPTGGFVGQPLGSVPGMITAKAVAEEIGVFSGLGVVIVFLAAAAGARFSVQGVRDVRAAEAARERRAARAQGAVPTGTGPTQQVGGETERLRPAERPDDDRRTDR